MFTDGKYHMLPNGDLMIINITRADAQMTYRCRTHHKLTEDTLVSPNVGRIQLAGNYKHADINMIIIIIIGQQKQEYSGIVV